MKVLVSACIMGENCKYDGISNMNPKGIELLQAPRGKWFACSRIETKGF